MSIREPIGKSVRRVD